MGADAIVIYYGVRFSIIEEEELSLLSKSTYLLHIANYEHVTDMLAPRLHPKVKAALDHGLQWRWGETRPTAYQTEDASGQEVDDDEEEDGEDQEEDDDEEDASDQEEYYEEGDAYLLIGKELTVLGWENQADAFIPGNALLTMMQETGERLLKAGFTDPAGLHAIHEPDH